MEALIRTSYYDQSKAERELGVSRSPLEPAIAELYAWVKVAA